MRQAHQTSINLCSTNWDFNAFERALIARQYEQVLNTEDSVTLTQRLTDSLSDLSSVGVSIHYAFEFSHQDPEDQTECPVLMQHYIVMDGPERQFLDITIQRYPGPREVEGRPTNREMVSQQLNNLKNDKCAMTAVTWTEADRFERSSDLLDRKHTLTMIQNLILGLGSHYAFRSSVENQNSSPSRFYLLIEDLEDIDLSIRVVMDFSR